MTNIEILAKQYSEYIKAWLNEEELQECADKNKTADYANSNAEHDYCDANVAMYDAYEKVYGVAPDLSNQAVLDIMSSAFALAKENDFYA